MKVTVFGSGYVGLVTGACLADVGNSVCCVDIDENKIQRLLQGDIPIYEPGLDRVVLDAVASGDLTFTTDAKKGVEHADVIFIAVGTPPQEDGSADLQYVLAVADTVGQYMNDYKVVVGKSTVPVGTCDKVEATVAAALKKRGVNTPFAVVSNPEFLKEGNAIEDFMKPDRIVVGTDDEKAMKRMSELYAPFNRSHNRVMFMDRRSSELTKYAANAMLATKISFINELSRIAELVGADIEHVRNGIGSDPRIGYQFIYPGCGYGGSCFPKDVTALKQTAEEYGYHADLLNAVENVNARQKLTLVEKIKSFYGDDLTGKTFAIWGLSFKPQTDDMREASSRVIMEELWAAGASTRAYDPAGMEETQHIYPNQPKLSLCGTKEAALKGVDALVICTEWKSFRSPDFDVIKESVADNVIFDGRNLYDPEAMADKGIKYYAIGRGLSLAKA
ncbi:UDP-glucose 6-dehydrogenase [BD1-7 clade bacterium]|uniref:UDP-glucose 6-dehydrogenase n=1 Tax=BD1-7 clade bacterium TaxID=2029982 RepID=A0A5S9QJ02_9GAMM|nr:UDP-glucose 6-dehydrogenase [BD1-7 clade bacterium]CAA0117626.1 UDP-glucose 6-dehydrogenase [BD1-7 clade bacterium]